MTDEPDERKGAGAFDPLRPIMGMRPAHQPPVLDVDHVRIAATYADKRETPARGRLRDNSDGFGWAVGPGPASTFFLIEIKVRLRASR